MAGVHFVFLRGEVRPAVVAFGEYGDGVHVSLFEAILKLLFVKHRADISDVLRRVKIEMNLSLRERRHSDTHLSFVLLILSQNGQKSKPAKEKTPLFTWEAVPFL